jgi:hypothetical protein
MLAEPLVKRLFWTVDEAPCRRVIVPALGGTRCLAQLMEIIRCAAAIYGYLLPAISVESYPVKLRDCSG